MKLESIIISLGIGFLAYQYGKTKGVQDFTDNLKKEYPTS